MRLQNLSKIFVYKPIKEKTNGEYKKTWEYLFATYINLQQDLNELDRNSAGEIDYDIYKGRTRKNLNIEKGYGIYVVKDTDEQESLNGSNYSPEYYVSAKPKVGKTVTYTLKKII